MTLILVVFSQQCETIYFSAVTSQNKKQAFSQLEKVKMAEQHSVCSVFVIFVVVVFKLTNAFVSFPVTSDTR